MIMNVLLIFDLLFNNSNARIHVWVVPLCYKIQAKNV